MRVARTAVYLACAGLLAAPAAGGLLDVAGTITYATAAAGAAAAAVWLA